MPFNTFQYHAAHQTSPTLTLMLHILVLLQRRTNCFRRVHEWIEHGYNPQNFSYPSWQAMYQDFLVFTLVRNPYSRAASGYDFIYQEHGVRTHTSCAQAFGNFASIASVCRQLATLAHLDHKGWKTEIGNWAGRMFQVFEAPCC